MFVRVAAFHLLVSTLSSRCSHGELGDFDYVDDVLLLSKDSGKLLCFLDRLNDSVGMFGVHF